MSMKLFLTLLRQYAREAQRRRRSYVAQVLVLLEKWEAAVEAGSADAEQQRAQVAWSFEVTDREYGAADPAWFDRPTD